MRGSAPKTEGLLAVKGGAAACVDSRQLDPGQLCRSRARDSSCGVGLGKESYPKRRHSGDGWVSHLKCKLEVQTETQSSAVSQELSAEALGEWKERKLSSEQHQVCLLSSKHAVSMVHVEPLTLPPLLSHLPLLNHGYPLIHTEYICVLLICLLKCICILKLHDARGTVCDSHKCYSTSNLTRFWLSSLNTSSLTPVTCASSLLFLTIAFK